jgi:hypothetical protein
VLGPDAGVHDPDDDVLARAGLSAELAPDPTARVETEEGWGMSVAGWDRESRSTETTPREACSLATCPLLSVAAKPLSEYE